MESAHVVIVAIVTNPKSEKEKTGQVRKFFKSTRSRTTPALTGKERQPSKSTNEKRQNEVATVKVKNATPAELLGRSTLKCNDGDSFLQ